MQADSPAVGQRLDWCLLPKTKGHDRDTGVCVVLMAFLPLCTFLRAVAGRLGRVIVPCVRLDCSSEDTHQASQDQNP